MQGLSQRPSCAAFRLGYAAGQWPAHFPLVRTRKSRLSGGFFRKFPDETSTRRRWLFVGTTGLSRDRADTCKRHGHRGEQREENHYNGEYLHGGLPSSDDHLVSFHLITVTLGRIQAMGRNWMKASLPRVRFLPLPRQALGFRGYYQSSRSFSGNGSTSSLPTRRRCAQLPPSTVFYGRISTIVPFGANLLISSISSSVTAIHPFVQSTAV